MRTDRFFFFILLFWRRGIEKRCFLILILTVNAGSSSVRLALFTLKGKAPTLLASSHYGFDERDSEAIHSAFLREHNVSKVDAVAHRVVHGGEKLTASCLIDKKVEEEISRLSTLAPLHNPVALTWIRLCRDFWGENVFQIAVFDTAFYATLPEVAATYALPRDLCRKYGLRRYGFHGLAHQAMWERWRQIHPELKSSRIITLQLGAGCSATAIDSGKPKDTSMGFSPLEGLVMATRSGDLDPGLLTYLQKEHGWTPDEVEGMLNRASGLLGVSGVSGDMRVLLEMDNLHARLAVALYCYRARKYIGAYLAVLSGAEAILFGGGVGENSALVRETILKDMEWCGIKLDTQANATTKACEGRISAIDSVIEVWVVPVDEATILAKEAISVMEKQVLRGG